MTLLLLHVATLAICMGTPIEDKADAIVPESDFYEVSSAAGVKSALVSTSEGVEEKGVVDVGGKVYAPPTEMSCKKGGSWTRPYGDVANSEAGFKDCASKCKNGGYKYFGLECPRNTIHCQCSNSLSGSTSVATTECDRKNYAGNTHCVGPYKHGNYLMGSHGTGSVYKVDQVDATIDVKINIPNGVPTEYVPPTEMSCKKGGSWTRPYGDVANSECDRKNYAGNTHCVGPYKHGNYLMGSHGTGSVYKVDAIAKATPLAATRRRRHGSGSFTGKESKSPVPPAGDSTDVRITKDGHYNKGGGRRRVGDGSGAVAASDVNDDKDYNKKTWARVRLEKALAITYAPTKYPTKHPTKHPTSAPTKSPTHHPCISGEHGCDKSEGGLCIQNGSGYTCGCKNGYKDITSTSTDGAHTCLKTPAPTPIPTKYPTGTPTRAPCVVEFWNSGGGHLTSVTTTTPKTVHFNTALEDSVSSYRQSASCGWVEYMDEDGCRAGYSDNLGKAGAAQGTLPYDLREDLCGIVIHSVHRL